jgi:hypothetical protein
VLGRIGSGSTVAALPWAGVGQALAEIRDRRLYRATNSTFEEYVHDKWVLTRTRAYRFIDAAKVNAVLSPIGHTPAMGRRRVSWRA